MTRRRFIADEVSADHAALVGEHADHLSRVLCARVGKQRKMTLLATEFLRRFFLHVLPKGFVRIRYFGFLANRFRAHRLPLCQQLLASDRPPPLGSSEAPSHWHCPHCGATMVIIQRLTAVELSLCPYFDSS